MSTVRSVINRVLAMGIGFTAVAVLTGCGEEAADLPGEASTTVVTEALDLGSGGASDDTLAEDQRGAGTSVGPLPADTYTTSAFAPALTFTVGDGWQLNYENADDLSLTIGDGVTATGILIFDVTGMSATVADPAVGMEGHITAEWHGDDAPGMELIPFPDDYEAFLRAQPDLDISAVRDEQVGGVAAVVFDVGLDRLPEGNCLDVGLSLCFSPIVTPGGPVFITGPDGSVATTYLLEVDGSKILLLVADAHLHPVDAAAVLESLVWAGQ